jgi:hypothetical protein
MKESSTSQDNKKGKFYPLAEHFRQKSEAVFTLTFTDIERIIGQPLCGSALKTKQYWQRRGDKNISFCWLSNGYAIRSLRLDKSRIVFERNEDLGGVVNIPPVFLSERIPHDAKVEAETMLKYIKNKYGL